MKKLIAVVVLINLIVIFALIKMANASQAYTVLPNTGTLSGVTLVNTINSTTDALLSLNIGTTAPSYGETGNLWVDTTTGLLKYNDGTQYEPIGSYNVTTGTFSSPILRMTNATSGGTTLNKLAKLTGAPSTLVAIGTTDSSGILGPVISGAGTTSSAHVALEDTASCVFDGATTAGDYVQASTTTAGDCHDASSTYPTSGQIVGRVLSTNGSGGTYSMMLFGPEIRGSSGGGGSGTVTSVATTSPITGGTFTTTGTIACATCVTSAASLTSGAIVIGGGSQASATDTSATLTAGALTLGASGTAGSVKMGNATTGTITLQPVTGALGTVTVSIPAATDTLVNLTGTQTLTNKTLTSPVLTTPALGVATATTINGVTIPSATDTTALLGTAEAFTATQAVTPTTLTISSSTFTPTFNSGNHFNITLVHASCPCTLANPSGTIRPGASGQIVVNQSSTGADTISTYGTDYIFVGSTKPTYSTAANARDILSYYNVDSTHIAIMYGINFQ